MMIGRFLSSRIRFPFDGGDLEGIRRNFGLNVGFFG